MKVNIVCLAFLIFIFARNISVGSALICYQCEEPRGRECDLNLRKVLTENCTESFVCAKYVWKDNVTSTVHRRCASNSLCEGEAAKATGNLTLEHCSTCDTTLCNSADSLSHSLVFHIFICVSTLCSFYF